MRPRILGYVSTYIICKDFGRVFPQNPESNSAKLESNSANLHAATLSGIQVLHNARVVFDEVASRLNIPAHQLGEDGFCLPLSLDHPSFVRTHKKD